MFQNNVLSHKGVSLRAEGVAIPEVGVFLEIASSQTHRNDNGKGCLLKLSKNPFSFKEEGVQNNFPAKCLRVKINKLFPFNLSLFALTFRG